MGVMGGTEPVPVRILIINPNTSVSMTDALEPMIEALGYQAVGFPEYKYQFDREAQLLFGKNRACTFKVFSCAFPCILLHYLSDLCYLRSTTHTSPALPPAFPQSTPQTTPQSPPASASLTSSLSSPITTPSSSPATASTRSSLS
jgi:hypothetical protein